MSRSPRTRVLAHARVRAAVVAAATAALLAPLAACTSDTGDPGTETDAKPRADDRPVEVTVTPAGERVPAGEPVRVTAAGGRLTSVTVTDAEGHKLAGKAASDGRSWVSDRKAAPGAAYTVTAAAKSEGGTAKSTKATFTTAGADKVNKVDWRPGAASTVGVAQPISLVFDNPVKNKAEVEKQLRVTTSNDTEGSWGWLTDWSGRDRVDWRPKAYWKPGTKVTLNAELNGTDSGTAAWLVRTRLRDHLHHRRPADRQGRPRPPPAHPRTRRQDGPAHTGLRRHARR